MRLTNKELYKAIRAGLTVGVIGAVGFTGLPGFTSTAVAQDQERTLDRIEVTGTRIKRVDVETASPVLSIERAEIEASGLQTVGQLLRQVSVTDNLGLTNVSSSTNAGDGSQTISLRNLGTQRTLVLVNGRRWIDAGGGVVDLTTIPSAIVERVEILKDGASAIYGSDAIAGVINIITRRDYEGAQANLYWGEFDEGDGRLQAYDFTVGASNDRGNITMTASYTKQDSIMAGDREISRQPIFGCATPIGGADCGSLLPARGVYFLPDGRVVTLRPEAEIAGLAPGSRTVDDFRPFTNADRYNFAPVNFLMLPSERTSFYTQGSYSITDNIRFSSSLIYAKRKSSNEIAEVPMTIDLSGPQWSFPLSGDSVYNPFGEDIWGVGYRSIAVGPRNNNQSYDNWGFVGSLDGFFELGSRFFSWETTYQHYESAQTVYGKNYINLRNLALGIGPSFLDSAGTPVCGSPGAPIAGCVPVDLMNGVVGMTPEMVNYISYTLVEEFATKRDNYLFNISGDLFELPGGMAGFAAGYEYRSDRLTDQPDALVAGGFSSNNFREPTEGTVKVNEFYAELVFPLLAGVTLADRLEFNLAARYSDYKSAGRVGITRVTPDIGDTTNLKAGFTWKPFEDLLVRGNWAETFRAPSIGNLFGGGGEGFPQATDPCASVVADPSGSAIQQACARDGVPIGSMAPQPNAQIRSLFGGNPNLQPEYGTTRTLGLVYSPSYLENLNLSLDWWKIKLNDGLATISAQGVLNRCYADGLLVSCGQIERRPSGEIQTIRAGNENLARLQVEGWDFTASYRFDTDFGRFSAVLDTTYLSDYRSVAQTSTLRPVNVTGQFLGTTSAYWRKRGNLSLDWSLGDWGANWTVRHYSKLMEPCHTLVNGFANGVFERQVCSVPVSQAPRIGVHPSTGLTGARNKIGATTYHDAQVRWNSPFNSTVRLGIRNLMDKDPPIALNSFANSFLQAYDIPGRYWYASYTQNF